MTVVFGIGNPNRSDDAVGPLILDALQAAELPEGVELIPFMGDGTGLTLALQNCRRAILIDAVLDNGPPGDLVIIDCNNQQLPPQQYLCSSHGFGLGEAIEMARALGTLPPWCFILGVRASKLETGHELSREVQDAIPRAVAWVTQQLNPS